MRRTVWALAIGAATMVAGAGPAVGQPKPAASAAPSAQPKDAKKGDAKKDDAKKDAASAPAGSALPAGHPQVGEGLPAGHPQVDDGEDAEPGAGPHGGARGGDPRFFNPPQDTVADDPSLPAGTLVVTIKDAQDRPIPGAPIALSILHSTVAKGDSRERKDVQADASGSARFDGLAFGSGHSYQVLTGRGAGRYGSAAAGLTDKAGKRIVVHAYDATANIEDLPVAMRGLVFVGLREDSILVEQLYTVFNLGPVAWTPDLTIPLPKGFKAFNKQDETGDARVEEVQGTGFALRGTFPPGRTDLSFRYQVPLASESAQSLKITMPPRVMQSRVIAEASRTMGLEVEGFPPAQHTEDQGKRLLITEHQSTPAERGVAEVALTLTGLPTPGQGRWVAVVLAVLLLAAGLNYLREHTETTIDGDTRRDLIEAREALLGEIVALERARQSGEVGPKSYERIRASLMDALARIVNMLDEAKKNAPAPTKGPRRPKAEPA